LAIGFWLLANWVLELVRLRRMLEFVRLMGMLAISCWENTLQPSTFAEATVDKSKNQTSSAVVVSPDQQLSV
jgi:hypothetical protein